jgi:hypothetical protein
MKKLIRIVSALLTAVMLAGGMSWVSLLDISAATEKVTTEEKLKLYLTNKCDTPQAKLSTMKLKLEKDGYQLWADELSGEVAVVNVATGQILFTNPYDIATTNGSASTKEQLMSQIVVRYVDNDAEKTFYSFVEAAYRDQIKFKNIKGGIRVEYTIGREETRMLVPKMISKERFEEKIYSVAEAALGAENFTFKKLTSYYQLKDTNECVSERAKAELIAAFPITKKMAVYIFDPSASEAEKRRVEGIIKTYCPEYTYEDLDYDHELTEYEGSDRAPALFKMALEYTLDEKGLSVRLPANGIRFDESEYKLSYISILPYMGAGANYAGTDKTKVQSGYTFFPDGSGSIFRFEKLSALTSTIIAGKIYGQDYAYQSIGGEHQEVIRYPAFGIVANDIVSKSVKDEQTGTYVTKEVEESRGYLAIIEEGDSMAEIYTNHAASLSKYNYMEMRFYPRPKDTYNLKDAISVGKNASVTVVSTRKYVGNYKIRYIMLTDDAIAVQKGITKYYETSWIGMATAFRDYLIDNGILKRLTSTDIKEDIPLYIETFGTIETVKKVLSIPVNTMVPLTSFEDIMKMYDDLSADGITNVDFKLTGYANGGMYSTVPYKLKWESAVGGKSGFEDLVAYATEKGFGVYPDFNFVYERAALSQNNLTDGLTLSKHLAKSIDNRYAARREYSALYQTYTSVFAKSVENIISSAYYSHFYKKLTSNYQKYGNSAISVSTLGSDLSSDFDEDEPYNREDSKQFTIAAFEYLDENYDSVMTSGGNAYTWKYVDHILNVSLDSSRYVKSSNSVPFIGVVLHGSIQFSGSPLNMEGNIGYAMLRTIENGASPYFILSYQNTTLLKEDAYLSKYYSVRYDIWYDQLVSIYNELNSALRDVQTKLIIDHEFLVGERVPDTDEIEADIRDAMSELEASLSKADKDAAAKAVKDILTARLTAKTDAEKTAGLLATVKQAVEDAKASITAIENALLAIPAAQAAVDSAVAAEANALSAYNAAQTAKSDALSAYNAVKGGTDTALIAEKKAAYDAAVTAEANAKAAYTAAQAATKAAQTNKTAADTALTNALKAGTTAADTADTAAANAASLAAEARAAAEFVNKVDSATADIKKAALDYAVTAEKNAAEALAYAKKANDNAAVAKAISADRTVAALISTAKTASDTATTRAADVAVKYDSLLKSKTAYEDAQAAEAEALKAYEDAQAAYAAALAAAALPTATEADKNAATAAGTAMNTAKAAYTAAQSATTKAKNTFNSSVTALKNSLQKVLDAKNSAIAAADSTAAALESAMEAAESLNTLEGISSTLKAAAIASCNEAKSAAADINLYVEAAKATYEASAELVKDYVVINETTSGTTTPSSGGNTSGSTTQDTAYKTTKYTNDNGNIVKVTYGDTDANGAYIAYKTFILNYNFFDVTVVVDGVTYTIPATGYVVFYH